MNKYPLYIPSKWRSQYMITSKALTKMWLKHYIIVEPQEEELYKKSIEKMSLSAEVIILDLKYKEKYETCDNLWLTKSTWPWPARNFAWDESIKKWYKYHWVMDDNISDFKVYHNNQRITTHNEDFFAYMEDFIQRYKNIYMWWPNYNMFAFWAKKLPAFVSNTRIYSCNFIKNDIPFRWRGRYNEDTILSLDILHAGYCTIQFNMFLQNKLWTQIIKWWNSDEFYFKEWKREEWERYTDKWTKEKSEMLAKVYPQYAKVKYKFNRIHHQVNYNHFKRQKFIKDKNWDIAKEEKKKKFIFKKICNK